MKKHCFATFLFILIAFPVLAQESDNAAILKIIFAKYYKEEKVIAKNRLQLLRFYCQKAPNNEEVFEVIAGQDLLKKNAAEIKAQIKAGVTEDWSVEYNIIFTNQNQYLKSKVNDCVSLEQFQAETEKYGENNQRLLIVNKPIYFAKNQYALVKVSFYRTIEHNSGRFLLLEKVNGVWIIKDYLNEWAT